MRIFKTSLFALLTALCFACDGAPGDFCGASDQVPTEDEVAAGQGVATLDGDAFSSEGTWGAGPSASIDLGVLSMTIVNDETGAETEDLITRGAFPICVLLGNRSETSGSANYIQGGFVTSDDVGGSVSILDIQGSNILGRFNVDLQNGGGESMSFTDGVFNVPQR